MGVCAVIKIKFEARPSDDELARLSALCSVALSLGDHGLRKNLFDRDTYEDKSGKTVDFDAWWRHHNNAETKRVCGWLLDNLARATVYYKTDHDEWDSTGTLVTREWLASLPESKR